MVADSMDVETLRTNFVSGRIRRVVIDSGNLHGPLAKERYRLLEINEESGEVAP
jgi:hypothetical protein